ncbi:uncharacterized protein tedc2 isoform X2 [Sphaeramia orbicularis]|uniref:uncharacterized protein tedc2 isoform X2 n=1 Tax=Sphaeramia orbicularis TaxID=375764 RepID=UPI00117C25B9|nr:uncharacterized protein LOC115424641 isoform X2 [Sphaeramia orbicularis]
MSLLITVENAIKSHKSDQAEINDSIQLYKEVLQTLAPQPKKTSKIESAGDTSPDTDTSPVEKEDLELLEEALEKALRVRSGLEPSRKHSSSNKKSGHQNELGATGVTSKEARQASGVCRGNPTSSRSTSKSATVGRKEDRKCSRSVSSTVGLRPVDCHKTGLLKAIKNRNTIQDHFVSSTGIVQASDQRRPTSTFQSKIKTVRSAVLSSKDLGKAAPSSHNLVSFSKLEEFGAHSLPQQNGLPSGKTPQWKYLKTKQNRLWDKVVAVQTKPASGRGLFMERMRATFPMNWPCGSPEKIRILVDRLTHQGQDFTENSHTKDLETKQTSAAGRALGGQKNNNDSRLTPETSQMTAADIKNMADQLKQEWEAWDRWRPDQGCLCSTGANSEWQNGIMEPLPLTISYTTESELLELEKLRMKVALLQQEIFLEQGLLAAVTPQLSSSIHGCANPSLLRDMYSLLGEGGERFPAIVLDSELDH